MYAPKRDDNASRSNNLVVKTVPVLDSTVNGSISFSILFDVREYEIELLIPLSPSTAMTKTKKN